MAADADGLHAVTAARGFRLRRGDGFGVGDATRDEEGDDDRGELDCVFHVLLVFLVTSTPPRPTRYQVRRGKAASEL